MSFFRALLLALSLLPPPAMAGARDVAGAMRVEPMTGWRQADGTHVAGLRVRLAPGWKTYWRSAGAAGIAPRMDWRGTRGARSVTPAWPTPTVFGPVGGRSIGYDRDFVLPLLVAVRGGGAVSLRGRLEVGVCANICMPARINVVIDLPAGGVPDAEIVAALADRPARVQAPMLCTLRPTRDGLALTGAMDLPSQGHGEAVVFELPDPGIWIADASVRREGSRLHAVAELLGPEGAPRAVDRSRLRATVIGSRGAVEVTGCTG